MENPVTNTTTPGNRPYLWVGESNQRSTFGILSFCLSTMIICVWSTLHFNIPTRRYTSTHRFFLEIAWVLFALFAPEALLYLAMNERIGAGMLLKKALESHPHLAKPGMITRMSSCIRGLATPRANRYNTTPQRYFTLCHAFYATMGGFAFYIYDDDKNTVEESLLEPSIDLDDALHVPSFDMCIYLVEVFPNIFTNISEESINDRAKSSNLSKALLIVQVGWFCTNCASRLIQHLPLSLLEITTAAHAFCTLLTYLVWWSKPLNIRAPTIIKGEKAREVHALLTCSVKEYGEALEMAQKPAAGDSSMGMEGNRKDKITLAANLLQHRLSMKEPRSFIYDVDGELIPGFYGKTWDIDWIIVTISPILYGLIHVLAWSEDFPTPLERSIWRASSVLVTCSGLIGPLGEKVIPALDWWEMRHRKHRGRIFSGIPFTIQTTTWLLIPVAYLVASGFLVGESIRQLFFLDPAAYQLPSWSNYWPHLS